jgi:HSP20 family protein
MNRLFDDFFTGFGLPMLGGGDGGRMLSPQLDVSETDQEMQIAAELPGIDEKNIEVTVADDMLTIQGEKQEERDQKERNYHLMERSYGTFSRMLRLPFAVDPQQVKAAFKDGVLRITIPKPKEVQQKTQRIEVRREETPPGTASQPSTAQAQQATEQKVPESAAE